MDSIKTTSKSLFDHLDAILKYKDENYFNKLNSDDKKTWNLYMINRFLSMESDYILLVNELDALTNGSNLFPAQIYRLYMNIFPEKRYRSKYIKSEKTQKYSSELIDVLKEYFNISKLEAMQYIDMHLMSKTGYDNLKNIVMKYGYTEKESTKFLKGLSNV